MSLAHPVFHVAISQVGSLLPSSSPGSVAGVGHTAPRFFGPPTLILSPILALNQQLLRVKHQLFTALDLSSRVSNTACAGRGPGEPAQNCGAFISLCPKLSLGKLPTRLPIPASREPGDLRKSNRAIGAPSLRHGTGRTAGFLYPKMVTTRTLGDSEKVAMRRAMN